MDIKDLSKTLYSREKQTFSDRMHLAVEQVQDEDFVLEVGVGNGELVKNIGKYKNVRLYAVDAAEGALNSVQAYLQDSELINISIQKMKFKDDFFDAVICLEVFEHLDNPYQALTEIQRVLRPGGKLMISIPNHLGGHIVIYPGLITHRFFKSFLRQNYFEIIDCRFWGPVWNKDNIGPLLESRIKNRALRKAVLRVAQAIVRLFQFICSLFFIKMAPLYWCYFYVCRNKKDAMEKPFWIKQLEQTSELGKRKGWYDKYYHRKV